MPSIHFQLQKVKEMAAQAKTVNGESLLDDHTFRRKIANVEIETKTLEFTENRIKAALGSGQNPGPAASMTKILGTEISQKVTELAIEAASLNALVLQPEAIEPGSGVDPIGPELTLTAMPRYLNTRATTIYGGSSEVQRGIIAKMVLGL